MFEIRLLGQFEVLLDGEIIEIPSRPAQSLLAYLLLNPGVKHRRERLAGLFWPDSSEESARSNLRHALWRVRKSIGESYFLADKVTVCFNPEADYVLDVTSFEGVTCDDASREDLTEVVSLYHGDLLPGFYDEWASLERERLRASFEIKIEALLKCLLEEGRWSDTVEVAERWIALGDIPEPAYRALMISHANMGNSAKVTESYQRCTKALRDEIDLEPSEETNSLYRELSSGEFAPSRIYVPSETVKPEDIPQIQDVKLTPPPSLEVLKSIKDDERIFVGREAELAFLHSHLQAAVAGDARVIFITGGAGRGKTTLMQEFAHRGLDSHPDLIALTGTCNAYTGVGDPYLPFRDIMGILTGDLEIPVDAGFMSYELALRLWNALPFTVQTLLDRGPSLIDIFVSASDLVTRLEEATSADEPWFTQLKSRLGEDRQIPGQLERHHLFDQYSNFLRTLANQHPLLLLIDDLQWADSASLNLLFHLGRRLKGSNIFIICVYRPEEVSLGRSGERHPLEKLLAEFKLQFGDIWLDLSHLDPAEDRRFVDAFLDTEPNQYSEAFREVVYQHTEGHPLFTAELMQAMQERGELLWNPEGYWSEGSTIKWDELPVRVEGLIEERIGQIEPELQEILSAASVEGDVFTSQVISRLLSIEERQLVQKLSQILEKRHRLIREREELLIGGRQHTRFQFTHKLYQQYLYDKLGIAERRLFHREVALVLEERYEGCAEEIAVQLAHHWEQAGEMEQALPYLLHAGDQSRMAYAYDEAADYYHRALNVLKEQREYQAAARTLMKLGLTHHTVFRFKDAREAYEAGFSMWQRVSEVEPDASLPQAPHPLRIALLEPFTLDPGLASSTSESIILEQLFSGLVEQTPEMSVIPDVAHRWEVLDDGYKYIFHLRDDVNWSDGTQVTANDFEFAWKRVLNPASEAALASLLYDIKGAKAYNTGTVKDPGELGVYAKDDLTLVVELEGPANYFPHLIANPITFPVPRHVVESKKSAWADQKNIVTNGPFTLASWQQGENMVLERNYTYHGSFSGNLEQVDLKFPSTDSPAFLKMYEEDLLDTFYFFFNILPQEEWDRIRHQFAGEYITGPSQTVWYVGFKANHVPFDDQRVRRSLTMAVEREDLAQGPMRGAFLPATGGIVPIGIQGHTPGVALPHDPTTAKQLLSEAGFPEGQGFPSLEFLTLDSPGQMPIIEYLQDQWETTLGISTIRKTVSLNDMLDQLQRDEPLIWFFGWSADYPDPDNFLRKATCWQFSGWQDETFSRLVSEARHITNQDTRMEMYRESEEILVEEAPILPLLYDRFHLPLKPWVRKYPASPSRRNFWKDVVIEPH
ncbi:MAG: AAA family ATPase [Anaerolineales bacterium]|nr:AAA family ATPase [Anaerolineales bacterium]